MTNECRIRVLSVDDHGITIEGVASVIQKHPDIELISQAQDGRSALHSFREQRPDVTLMDLSLPDMSGIDALKLIRKEVCDAKVIMLIIFDGDVSIKRALAAGARGYLLKSTPPQAIVKANRDVHAGKIRIPSELADRLAEHFADESLSEREIEVLKEVANGIRNRDIGTKLFITEATVKAHIKSIMAKLGASDRTQAVTIAARRGIIHF
jgi:DNA-binding NarL/FixJ family response regulator